MGDRANIKFVEVEGGEIFFYTHWSGTELPEILAAALDRGRDRWNDESYLARIIFSEMVKDDLGSNTGAGISTYRTDYEYDDLIVSVKDQRIYGRGGDLSFEDFVTHHKEAS